MRNHRSRCEAVVSDSFAEALPGRASAATRPAAFAVLAKAVAATLGSNTSCARTEWLRENVVIASGRVVVGDDGR